MTKRPSRPKPPRKIRRNPLARVVRTAKFRERVVARANAYKRRSKHPAKPDDEA